MVGRMWGEMVDEVERVMNEGKWGDGWRWEGLELSVWGMNEKGRVVCRWGRNEGVNMMEVWKLNEGMEFVEG